MRWLLDGITVAMSVMAAALSVFLFAVVPRKAAWTGAGRWHHGDDGRSGAKCRGPAGGRAVVPVADDLAQLEQPVGGADVIAGVAARMQHADEVGGRNMAQLADPGQPGRRQNAERPFRHLRRIRAPNKVAATNHRSTSGQAEPNAPPGATPART